MAIPVVAASPLGAGRALAVARCEPGEGLDLTRGLVVWVEVSWRSPSSEEIWLQIDAGEGAGIHEATGELCLSAYARALLEGNLRALVPAGQGLQVQVIFPAGRRLAERTSNAAFGVVDGLALIGTQATVQRSADRSFGSNSPGRTRPASAARRIDTVTCSRDAGSVAFRSASRSAATVKHSALRP